MKTALVWFRRDLRSVDHAALSHALTQFERVHCAFVFDTAILDALPSRRDRRVEFIWHSVVELDGALAELAAAAGVQGAGLIVVHGRADDEIPALARELGVQAVLANRDYEPEALARDARVAQRLAADGIAFRAFKDQVVFECDEVLTREGRPFSVYTPYRNAWRRRLEPAHLAPFPVAPHAHRLAPRPSARQTMPTLAALGFERTDLTSLRLPTGMRGGQALADDFIGRIARYREARDYPARKGVSYLSVHLRFGTVSVRELYARALAEGSDGAQCWVDELIWREFFQMILWHHPQVVDASFRPEYDRVRWEDDPAGFAAWQAGRTGYPIVDAGMRQLRQSGYMHNRLRMVTASFLTKDLGIDWRLGERHFAALLNDYDLAANNGGWQWAASTGCDAQPYFRIFNPVTQSERFDPTGDFIRRYVPELARVPTRYIHAPWLMSAADQAAAGVRIGRDYPAPLVDHAAARQRTLARYAVVKG
ncbi:deoxyribodipyrimidine photolyase [Rhodocyclaceae bacterium]|jgi:deoxyribodipyrimidine photo-lyase|nr:deoxyribodipyrimidine photolyase [Rhodocyclaceae bacterium]